MSVIYKDFALSEKNSNYYLEKIIWNKLVSNDFVINIKLSLQSCSELLQLKYECTLEKLFHKVR